MASSEIIAQIDAHMKQSGVPNANWYVGIAADREARLFADHCVDRNKGTWIYRQAATDAATRSIEDAYHAAGCDDGSGGGDRTSVFVYAYVKTRTAKK